MLITYDMFRYSPKSVSGIYESQIQAKCSDGLVTQLSNQVEWKRQGMERQRKVDLQRVWHSRRRFSAGQVKPCLPQASSVTSFGKSQDFDRLEVADIKNTLLFSKSDSPSRYRDLYQDANDRKVSNNNRGRPPKVRLSNARESEGFIVFVFLYGWSPITRALTLLVTMAKPRGLRAR